MAAPGGVPINFVMSALPPKADMCSATRDVRFVPIADMGEPPDCGKKNAFALSARLTRSTI